MMTALLSEAAYSKQDIEYMRSENRRLKAVLEHIALCIKGASDISKKDRQFDLLSALEDISATAMDASGNFQQSSAPVSHVILEKNAG